ncbi:unnamed protein product [Choristocarpus tenellus]
MPSRRKRRKEDGIVSDAVVASSKLIPSNILTSRPSSRVEEVVDDTRKTKTSLVGRLHRCPPIFNRMSDIIFCASSCSVLALGVETGEKVFALSGHTSNVTAMVLLPDGLMGGNSPGLLTSSLDKTLRLWDIGDENTPRIESRCRRVLDVGMPVFHLFLGGVGKSGSEGVILVTKRGTSRLHGLCPKEEDKNAIVPATTPSSRSEEGEESMVESDDAESVMDSEGEEDDFDDDMSDDEDNLDTDVKECKTSPGKSKTKAGAGDLDVASSTAPSASKIKDKNKVVMRKRQASKSGRRWKSEGQGGDGTDWQVSMKTIGGRDY